MQVDYLTRLQRFNSSILTLYRGQIMTWNNLENKFRINKGNLVSMNSFLSTTTDRHVARMFSGDGAVENSEIYVSVLYEITIYTRLYHLVSFDDEAEVLFFVLEILLKKTDICG
jgi:hypothetical protein